MIRKSFLLFLLFAGAMPAVADVSNAQEAYMRGTAQEKAKNYDTAILEYKLALESDPNYFYAYKQLGSCYYYLGKKAEALEAYDRYLLAKPSDTQIKSFADGLRKQIGSTPATTPTPSYRRSYGIRGALGYAMALNDGGFGYGRWWDQNIFSNPDPGIGDDPRGHQAFPGSPGAGLAMGGEFLVGLRSHIELGLGFFPLGLNSTGTSTISTDPSTGYTETTSAASQFGALPFVATIYSKFEMMPRLDLVFGAGMGYAMGGTLKAHDTQSIQANGSSNRLDTVIDLDKSLDGSVAYRGVLGVEYAVTPNISIFTGMSLLSVMFQASKDVLTRTDTYSNGQVNTRKTTINYAGSPPAATDPTFTTSYPSANVTVYGASDSQTTVTETETYIPAGGYYNYDDVVTTNLPSGLGQNGLAFNQLSFFINATYRW